MMIRSIIICQDDQISTIHLGLFPEEGDTKPAVVASEGVRLETEAQITEQPLNSIEKNLSQEMAELVRVCIDANDLVPIGRWLEEDLILASLTAHNEVAYRAANALSIPETTIRRKISKIRRNRSSDSPTRYESWNRVQSLLRQIIPIARNRGVPAIELANQLLIAQIRLIATSIRQGAMLAGVSIPTYRRMLKELP
jgi:hypothetical protein